MSFNVYICCWCNTVSFYSLCISSSGGVRPGSRRQWAAREHGSRRWRKNSSYEKEMCCDGQEVLGNRTSERSVFVGHFTTFLNVFLLNYKYVVRRHWLILAIVLFQSAVCDFLFFFVGFKYINFCHILFFSVFPWWSFMTTTAMCCVQVNQKILNRLHQVQRITRRLKKERRYMTSCRYLKVFFFLCGWTFLPEGLPENSADLQRFLMKTLDHHGDDYRNAQLTILLEVRFRDIKMLQN